MFPVTKRIWPSFYGEIDCDKPLGMDYKRPKGFLTKTAEVILNFVTSERLLKAQYFEERGDLSVEEDLLAYFFS